MLVQMGSSSPSRDEHAKIFELPPSRLGTVGYLGGRFSRQVSTFQPDVLGEKNLPGTGFQVL